MIVGTSEIIRSIDKYCIESLGIPSIVLMENAALKVIKNIELSKFNSYVIVCGKGNNGGDGLAVARHLYVKGKDVEVFLVGTEEHMSSDCKVNLNILKNLGVKIKRANNVEDVNELRDALERSDITIDAIFGTGIGKSVEGIYDSVITIINENSRYILSIDVPSGFHSDTGRILANCIRADKTISFQMFKKGFLNYGSDKFTGEIIVEDIGIPEAAINKFHDGSFIMDKKAIEKSLKVRDKYAHKGDYGRVMIAAGAKGFTGAAFIAAEACVRSGAGLVTLACHEEIQQVMSSKLVEAMTVSFNDTEKYEELICKSDAIALGPGMGNNETTKRIVMNVLEMAKCPVVLDADGINILEGSTDILKKKNCQVILTPHFGEMSRLTGLPIEYIRENRIEAAKDFAKNFGVIVLLKGYSSVITDGSSVIINPTGNSSMASGGMGDCLTGIIAAFLGQGYKPLEAASLAAYIHGCCGEELSKGMSYVNASHLLEAIPYVIKKLQDGRL